MSFNLEQKSSQTHNRECLFKIIVIGDISTGKTSLIQRYVHNSISQNYKPTLGVDFATKFIQYEDTLVRIQFWDISGQERFANITRVYYRDSHGAIIVYDCKRAETLKGAQRWKKDLDSKLILDNGQPIPSIIVANKCDLENNVTEQSLKNFANQNNFLASFKISAKTGEGIDKALNYLIGKIIDAENDILYVMPIFQRDLDVKKLALNDDEKKSKKLFFKNFCC